MFSLLFLWFLSGFICSGCTNFTVGDCNIICVCLQSAFSWTKCSQIIERNYCYLKSDLNLLFALIRFPRFPLARPPSVAEPQTMLLGAQIQYTARHTNTNTIHDRRICDGRRQNNTDVLHPGAQRGGWATMRGMTRIRIADARCPAGTSAPNRSEQPFSRSSSCSFRIQPRHS